MILFENLSVDLVNIRPKGYTNKRLTKEVRRVTQRFILSLSQGKLRENGGRKTTGAEFERVCQPVAKGESPAEAEWEGIKLFYTY